MIHINIDEVEPVGDAVIVEKDLRRILEIPADYEIVITSREGTEVC